eukprot:scaffold111_cov404-Prasinococcus_capsulatus_cf.AAC.21
MELADEIALLPPGPKKLPFVASLRLTQESLHSVVREHSLQHLGPVDDKEPSRMRVNLGAKTFQVGEQVFKLLAVDELNPCEAFCPHSNSQSFLRLGDVKTKLRVQRNLDDKEGARVKEKFLGAEKKANSHKAQLLDGSTRVVTGQHTPRIVKEIGSANSSKAKAAGETYSAQKNQAVNRSMARQGRGSTVPPPAGAKGSPNAAGGRDVEPKKHVPHAKRKLASRVRPRSAVGSASGPGLENDKRMRRKLINALRTRPMSLKSLGKELGGVNAQTLVPTLQLVADFKAPGYYHLKPEYQDAVSGESDDQQLQMGAVLDSNQSRAVDGPPNKRQKRQTPEETRETAGQAASGVGSSLEQIRRAGGVVPKLEFGGVDPEFFAKYEDVKVGSDTSAVPTGELAL